MSNTDTVLVRVTSPPPHVDGAEVDVVVGEGDDATTYEVTVPTEYATSLEAILQGALDRTAELHVVFDRPREGSLVMGARLAVPEWRLVSYTGVRTNHTEPTYVVAYTAS